MFLLYVLLVWTLVFSGTWFLTPRINSKWRMKIDDPTQALVMTVGEVSAIVRGLAIVALALSPFFMGSLVLDWLDLLVSVAGLIAIHAFTLSKCPKTHNRSLDINGNAVVS